MTRRRRQLSASDDEGSILVTVALALPVFLALLVFVVDLANFFEHKRHLQVQADAGVLAAVHELRAPCTDAPAIGRANQYGGLASYTGGGPFNVQIGGTSQGSIHSLLNSRTFYGQASPVDASVDTSGPCASRMVDMKLTESGLPLFFGLAQFSNINAHARAEVRKLRIARNFIPLSVSDAVWKTGLLSFYDESTSAPGTLLGTRSITPNGTSGSGLAIWDNASSTFPITFASGVKKIGVKVALSTTTSTTCGDTGVSCFSQVLFMRGYAGAPAVTTSSSTAGAAPQARSVAVTGSSCNDGSFTTTATTSGASCTVTIAATVDWGQANPASAYTASMTASVNGGSAVTLTGGSGGPPNLWTGTLSIPANAGPLPITLGWKAIKGTIAGTVCGNGNGKNPPPCTGTFGTVQRTFSSSTSGSGPIQAAEVWTGATLATAVKQSSFRQCDSGNGACAYPMIVRIGLPPSLGAAQAVSDPVYRMRPLDGNSQTHALDCDSALSSLADELAYGCGSQANSSPKAYSINSGEACASYNNPGALPDPSPCAVTQTGQSPSQIGKGLNLRVYGDTKPNSCPAAKVNHWSSFPNLPSGDPRLVYVLLTDYGSFTGSGNEGFPVRRFAAFYITGWQGNSGFTNPCQGNGDDAAATGEVVGHFINYVEQVNNGGAGDELCDLTALSLCVPVLTR